MLSRIDWHNIKNGGMLIMAVDEENENKCIVYVPYHPELGYVWPRLTMIFSHTTTPMTKDWVWRKFVIDGNNYNVK